MNWFGCDVRSHRTTRRQHHPHQVKHSLRIRSMWWDFRCSDVKCNTFRYGNEGNRKSSQMLGCFGLARKRPQHATRNRIVSKQIDFRALIFFHWWEVMSLLLSHRIKDHIASWPFSIKIWVNIDKMMERKKSSALKFQCGSTLSW